MFTKKKIQPSKRVCLRLKEAREAADMTIEQVSLDTKIDKRYIKALEECHFEELPEAKVYRKNFIKLYLRAIGINPTSFVKQYTIEEEGGEKTEQNTQHLPTARLRTYHFRNIPFVLRTSILACVVLLLVGYLALQVKHIVEPPTLVLFTPEHGEVTKEKTIIIKGQTEPEVQITINGNTVVNDDEGIFEESIDLTAGVNEIQIAANKKYGKQTQETRHVVLQEARHLSFQEAEDRS